MERLTVLSFTQEGKWEVSWTQMSREQKWEELMGNLIIFQKYCLASWSSWLSLSLFLVVLENIGCLICLDKYCYFQVSFQSVWESILIFPKLYFLEKLTMTNKCKELWPETVKFHKNLEESSTFSATKQEPSLKTTWFSKNCPSMMSGLSSPISKNYWQKF